MTRSAIWAGMAKAMPTLPPDGEKIAVLTPMTSPLEVEGGTTRVAAVHRRVDLDEVVIGAGADLAAVGRDDAGRHRAAEAEGIADGDDPVADADIVLGELDVGELAVGIDLEEREVGLLVDADDLGVVLGAVVEDDGDASGLP